MEEVIRSYISNRRFVDEQFRNCVDEEDAVTLLSILVEIGSVNVFNLPNGFNFEKEKDPFINYMYPERLMIYKTKGRRIVDIVIGWSPNWNLYWNFHEQRVFELLGLLDKLEVLVVTGCLCFRLYETVSKLPNLKRLTVGLNSVTSIGPRAIMHNIKEETNLETLYLGNYTMACEDDLAMFLFDTISFFPKLSTFGVGYNAITSFQRIAEIIVDANPLATTPVSRLRHLDLGIPLYSPFNDFSSNIPKEIEAAKILYHAFPELCWIRMNGDLGFWMSQNAVVKYLMEINYVARVLVEAKERKSTLPLSVWTMVLNRAVVRSCFDGIYYIFQNVQELHARNKR